MSSKTSKDITKLENQVRDLISQKNVDSESIQFQSDIISSLETEILKLKGLDEIRIQSDKETRSNLNRLKAKLQRSDSRLSSAKARLEFLSSYVPPPPEIYEGNDFDKSYEMVPCTEGCIIEEYHPIYRLVKVLLNAVKANGGTIPKKWLLYKGKNETVKCNKLVAVLSETRRPEVSLSTCELYEMEIVGNHPGHVLWISTKGNKRTLWFGRAHMRHLQPGAHNVKIIDYIDGVVANPKIKRK